jgi:hypothetical protein
MEMEIVSLIMQAVTLVMILAAIAFFKRYVEKKAKNFATKQDIDRITQEVESIKAEIPREQPIPDAKYKLKHQAYIEALCLIDAILSHKTEQPAKQYMTTEQARQCHSKLILACDNPDILRKFVQIVFDVQQEASSGPATDRLNELRNLIREELGFAEELPLDREREWIGNVICEKRESEDERQIELAEEVLELFYNVRDAITAVRSGLGSDSFASLVDTVEKRVEQRTQTFNKLRSMRPRFVLQFGPDEAKPFEEIEQVLIRIRNAVDRLREIGDAHGQTYDEDDDEQLISTMKDYEAILTCGCEDEDEIGGHVKRAVSQMEMICNRIIMRG